MKKNGKKIIFTVINDLVYDRRMERICSTLASSGYQVKLVGRLLEDSPELKKKNYEQHRMKCWFRRSAFFYIEYNIRLFWYLLFSKTDIYGAVDLDTIFPHRLVSILKSKPMVYDAHEYFTEVIEIQNKKFVKWVWKTIERMCLSEKTIGYTVSQSYAGLFREKHACDLKIIRNVPYQENKQSVHKPNEFTFVYVGAVNAGRGIEECIQAIDGLDARLKICGDGDVLEDLKKTLPEHQKNQVDFTGYLTPEELEKEAFKSHCGVLLLRAESKSYYYSLANKFFDYIHAEIPQIVIDFPEYKLLNEEYKVGVLSSISVMDIRSSMERLMNDQVFYQELVENTKEAKHVFNWEEESKKLLKIYEGL